MSPNRTSVWKVMTILISRKLSLFNFENLDLLCFQIEHPCDKVWPFEFLESFRCSISSVSIYYFPESDICVKSYDHSNFSKASAVKFWASRYIMSPNRPSEWNVMTNRNSRELPLFNFEPLDELCPQIEHSCEKLWPFEFLESFRCSISSVSIYYVPKSDIHVKSYDHLYFSRASVVQFWVSRYIISPNRTFVLKVMTILISWKFSLFNFERVDELCPEMGHPCQKLWPFKFLKSFLFSILSISISYVPKSNISVKSYDHLNFLRASATLFRASLYIMSLNRTSVWKVMTNRISRELPLFNFECHDELCPRIGHLCENL